MLEDTKNIGHRHYITRKKLISEMYAMSCDRKSWKEIVRYWSLGTCPVQYLGNIGPAKERPNWSIFVIGPLWFNSVVSINFLIRKPDKYLCNPFKFYPDTATQTSQYVPESAYLEVV